MTQLPRRPFDRRGDTLVDVYGRNSAGKPVSFIAPVHALAHMRWDSVETAGAPERPDSVALQQRTEAARLRLRDAPLDALTESDLLEVARIGDLEAAALIEARFSEMTLAWRDTQPRQLACAASSILAMNPRHLLAASELVELIFSEPLSPYDRSGVARALSLAFHPERETEAMDHLRSALSRLVRDDECWERSMYACIRHLLTVEPQATLRRCEQELETRDGFDREVLLSELAEAPGTAVAGLLVRHFKQEPSPRLRVHLVRVLGELLSEARRVEALRGALEDESPSCRFLAIKTLTRVKAKSAHRLAAASLPPEPDAQLRGLLEQVISATG